MSEQTVISVHFAHVKMENNCGEVSTNVEEMGEKSLETFVQHPQGFRENNCAGQAKSTCNEDGADDSFCAVCGDGASGNFFGAVVCLPCKSFFIRCTKDGERALPQYCKGQCDINKYLRNRCQYCRYQRCLLIGMNRKEKPVVVKRRTDQELCRICGDLANGVHFGVYSCEGCKKFYRRGLKESHLYVCRWYGRCHLTPRNRNSCRYCRFQKCLAAGMSRAAIKMGRPRKRSSQSIANNTTCTPTLLLTTVADENISSGSSLSSGNPRSDTADVQMPVNQKSSSIMSLFSNQNPGHWSHAMEKTNITRGKGYQSLRQIAGENPCQIQCQAISLAASPRKNSILKLCESEVDELPCENPVDLSQIKQSLPPPLLFCGLQSQALKSSSSLHGCVSFSSTNFTMSQAAQTFCGKSTETDLASGREMFESVPSPNFPSGPFAFNPISPSNIGKFSPRAPSTQLSGGRSGAEFVNLLNFFEPCTRLTGGSSTAKWENHGVNGVETKNLSTLKSTLCCPVPSSCRSHLPGTKVFSSPMSLKRPHSFPATCSTTILASRSCEPSVREAKKFCSDTSTRKSMYRKTTIGESITSKDKHRARFFRDGYLRYNKSTPCSDVSSEFPGTRVHRNTLQNDTALESDGRTSFKARLHKDLKERHRLENARLPGWIMEVSLGAGDQTVQPPCSNSVSHTPHLTGGPNGVKLVKEENANSALTDQHSGYAAETNTEIPIHVSDHKDTQKPTRYLDHATGNDNEIDNANSLTKKHIANCDYSEETDSVDDLKVHLPDNSTCGQPLTTLSGQTWDVRKSNSPQNEHNESSPFAKSSRQLGDFCRFGSPQNRDVHSPTCTQTSVKASEHTGDFSPLHGQRKYSADPVTCDHPSAKSRKRADSVHLSDSPRSHHTYLPNRVQSPGTFNELTNSLSFSSSPQYKHASSVAGDQFSATSGGHADVPLSHNSQDYHADSPTVSSHPQNKPNPSRSWKQTDGLFVPFVDEKAMQQANKMFVSAFSILASAEDHVCSLFRLVTIMCDVPCEVKQLDHLLQTKLNFSLSHLLRFWTGMCSRCVPSRWASSPFSPTEFSAHSSKGLFGAKLVNPRKPSFQSDGGLRGSEWVDEEGKMPLRHREILQEVGSLYEEMLEVCDETWHRASLNGTTHCNQSADGPNQFKRNVSRIVRNTRAVLRFAYRIPGMDRIHPTDRCLLIRKDVLFSVSLLLHATEFYNASSRQFSFFLHEGEIADGSPMHAFKQHLETVGGKVHALKLDRNECALVCALSFLCHENEHFKNRAEVQHVFDDIFAAFLSYNSCVLESDAVERSRQVFQVIPQVRLVGLWHTILMEHMAFDVQHVPNSLNKRGTTV